MLQYTSCLDISPSLSNPFLMHVPSRWAYTSDITFHTSSVNVNGSASNYITIVTTTEAKDDLTLDGMLIS